MNQMHEFYKALEKALEEELRIIYTCIHGFIPD
jgi:hypothetical protein